MEVLEETLQAREVWLAMVTRSAVSHVGYRECFKQASSLLQGSRKWSQNLQVDIIAEQVSESRLIQIEDLRTVVEFLLLAAQSNKRSLTFSSSLLPLFICQIFTECLLFMWY